MGVHCLRKVINAAITMDGVMNGNKVDTVGSSIVMLSSMSSSRPTDRSVVVGDMVNFFGEHDDCSTREDGDNVIVDSLDPPTKCAIDDDPTEKRSKANKSKVVGLRDENFKDNKDSTVGGNCIIKLLDPPRRSLDDNRIDHSLDPQSQSIGLLRNPNHQNVLEENTHFHGGSVGLSGSPKINTINNHSPVESMNHKIRVGEISPYSASVATSNNSITSTNPLFSPSSWLTDQSAIVVGENSPVYDNYCTTSGNDYDGIVGFIGTRGDVKKGIKNKMNLDNGSDVGIIDENVYIAEESNVTKEVVILNDIVNTELRDSSSLLNSSSNHKSAITPAKGGKFNMFLENTVNVESSNPQTPLTSIVNHLSVGPPTKGDTLGIILDDTANNGFINPQTSLMSLTDHQSVTAPTKRGSGDMLLNDTVNTGLAASKSSMTVIIDYKSSTTSSTTSSTKGDTWNSVDNTIIGSPNHLSLSTLASPHHSSKTPLKGGCSLQNVKRTLTRIRNTNEDIKQKEVERDESVEVRRIEDDITELLEMGFNRREARQCYRDAGKNLQLAIAMLLSNPN